MSKNQLIRHLNNAHEYATKHSGCTKVAVGSVIVHHDGERSLSFGTNRTFPNTCRTEGCLREQLYGNNSKSHRNPQDCRAIHSEIDAITGLLPIWSIPTYYMQDLNFIVTRYPCENCARAIAASGIKNVFYGRKEKISSETARIFEYANVKVVHVDDWDAEDNNN